MSDAAPNDTYFSYQWNLKNVSYPGIDINYVNARNAFAFPYINDIIVAVVDNGVYNNHDDLHLYNVSYNAHTGGIPSGLYGDHGTKVAGVIGATANNGKGIAGVASGVKIMPISICYTDNELGIAASTTTNFANAIRFAANNGARVINNSWSFDTSSPISEINNAITYAHGKGCIVVFSSGNKGSAVSQPAAGAPSATLVVGAIDRNGYKSDFSGYGSSLDVVAPGREIWTTDVTGGYTCVSGHIFCCSPCFRHRGFDMGNGSRSFGMAGTQYYRTNYPKDRRQHLWCRSASIERIMEPICGLWSGKCLCSCISGFGARSHRSKHRDFIVGGGTRRSFDDGFGV